MKKPLNYAVLHFFSSGHEGSRKDVQAALKDEYSNYRAFKDKQMDDCLQTACSNGLIEETGYDLDENGELVVSYKACDDAVDTIKSYVGE